MADPESFTLLMDALRARAKEMGYTGAKADQYIRNTEIALRQTLEGNQAYGKALQDLFLYRKDAAKKLVDNIIDIGKKAGDNEVDLMAHLERSKADAAKVAALTNIENQGKVEAQRGGWSGFFSIVGEIFAGVPGCQGIADWCNDRARNLAPRTILSNNAQLQEVKANITIDPKSAVGRALSVTQAALLPTDPGTVGLTDEERRRVQTDVTRIQDVDKPGGAVPINIPGADKAPAAPAPAAAASAAAVGSIEAMAKDVLAKVSKESKIDQAKIDQLVRGIVAADTLSSKGGNKNGKIDGTEGAAFHQSPAYQSLDAAQKKILDKHLGLTAEGRVAAPSGPAPVPN